MRYVVTSDVHLGSNYSRVDLFISLIKRLKPDVSLVLAGDVIDDPHKLLNEAETEAVRLLAERSTQSNVIWVNGNHDDQHRPKDPREIEFCQTFCIDGCLIVAHGDRFDNVMPRNRWFIRLFRFFHKLRIRLGASPVHVADYAKRFGALYSFLCNNVRDNAVENAMEHNVPAIACGHVHFAEDTVKAGIRYFNLGAWTEDPTYVLLVDEDSFELLPTSDAMERPDWFSSSES